MARQVKVRALLNKGRKGVSLDKLPKVLTEFRQFLHALSEDLGVDDSSGWQGVDFKETASLQFTAIANSIVEDPAYTAFNESAMNVVLNRQDTRISRKTRYQYAQMASPLDVDETISIGIEQPQTGEEGAADFPPVVWNELTKQGAQQIQRSVRGIVTARASVQGIIHSVFIEADQPHFQLRELSTKDLITCNYCDSTYDDLATALKQRRAVVHVFGTSKVDTLSNKIDVLTVDRIEIAPSADKSFLDRFIGCSPGLVTDIQATMDRARRRGN
ncbi:MAG: hypothetical protein ACLQGV_14360 [Bryobacteraceae bacterium]